MAKGSNQKKAEQLGMPLGTASHRLRKKIMFDLLQRLGEAVCFKCSTPIECEDELSIEHKQPWLHGDTQLFWDLSNIAFSHLRCNLPDRRKTGNRRHAEAPSGKAWCSAHKDYLDTEKFGSNKRRINGLSNLCRDCDRKRWTSQREARRT